MTRLGADATAYALDRVGERMPDSGLCLQFTRENFAIAPYYYSAIDAWNGSEYRQAGDRNPPPAVPVYFHTSSPYRHVAFWCGDGVIVSTFNDEIRRYDGGIAQVETVFDGPYLGWTPGLNEVQVYYPPAPAPEEDDDVQVMVKWADDAPWFLTNWQTKTALQPGDAELIRDLGIITAEAYALGARYVPRARIDAIPDAG